MLYPFIVALFEILKFLDDTDVLASGVLSTLFSFGSTPRKNMSVSHPPEERDGRSLKYADMDDSDLTSPTVTDNGSVSDEDGGGGWFGIGADLKTFARSIKSTVPTAIDGIATAISRSAMAVAAEFSELERDAEQEAKRWREENYGTTDDECATTLHLPWETECDASGVFVEDSLLKKKILSLSENESTFLKPFNVSSATGGESITSRGFVLDEARIDLIRRLLDIDENLAAIHARLSGRSDVKETVFWRNYFHHCERLRSHHYATKTRGTTPAPASGNSSGSLTPAHSCEDDTSFVIASPPTSMNSVFSTHSFGDMVFVGGTEALDTHAENEDEGA